MPNNETPTGVTLEIGQLVLTGKISTYNCQRETVYPRVVTTMDGIEHAAKMARDVVTFSLFPISDADATALYNALVDNYVTVKYTRQWSSADVTAYFRLASDLGAAFGIRSIDGNRYYKGGEIRLRRRDVGANSI